MPKKVISIALALIIIFELQAVVSFAQDNSADNGITENNQKYDYLEVPVSYFGEALEKNELMVCNGYVYADIRELSNRLGLIYEVSDEYINSEKDNNQNNYIEEFKNGYAEAFSEAEPSSLEIRVRKKNSCLVFYFRPGSQNAFAYSMYFGKYCYDMGGSIIVDKGKIWAPLASFLYLVDSYCYADEEKLNIGHSALTVTDILHRVGLEDYHFDIVDQFGEKSWIIWLKSQYNDYYKRVKNFIGGGFTLDLEKLKRTMTYDDIADVLSLQLYTANSSEIESLQDEYKGIGLLIDATTALSDSMAGLSEAISNGAAFDAETHYFNNLIDYNYYCPIEDIQRAAKEASQAVQKSSHASAYNSIMSTTSNAITVVASLFSTYLTYITYINEINESNKDYIPAVQKYLDYYSNSNIRGLSKDLIELIRKKGNLYQSSNNIFDNDELLEATTSAFATNTIKMETGAALAPILPTVVGAGLIATLGWDVSEKIVNRVSGGTFDHLDSAENTYFAMQLETDAEKILNLYKYSIIHENAYDFDTYRYLEWIRLKSYCIAREDAIQYSQRMLKKHPSEIGGVISEWQSEERELNSLMSVLISGTHEGLTPEKIKRASEETDTMNIKLGEQVKGLTNIPDNPFDGIPENAMDYMLPIVNAQISMNRYNDIGKVVSTSCGNEDTFWGTLWSFCNTNFMDFIYNPTEGISYNSFSGLEIKSSVLKDLAYAIFSDYTGDIPDTSFEPNTSIQHDASKDMYTFIPASMHDYVYRGKTAARQNEDGTITATYLYEESFWGDREGPEKIAFDVNFCINDHVNKDSNTPYYYTIESIEQLEPSAVKKLSLLHLDISDYLSKPQELIQLLHMQEDLENEENKKLNVSEEYLSEYKGFRMSLRMCEDRIEIKNSGDSDVTLFGIGVEDSFSEVEDVLYSHGWEYYSQNSDNENVEMYAYTKRINNKNYILALRFIYGSECIEWKLFNYSTDFSDNDLVRIKTWLNTPLEIEVSEYSKPNPWYWYGTNRWTIYTVLTLENGAMCGAEVDAITYSPQRAISTYYLDENHKKLKDNVDQEGTVAAAKPTEMDVDSNSTPLDVTNDVLCMNAKDAASYLRLTEKAEFHEPDIEYVSYYYIQKGRDLFDGSSYLEYFPEYDMTGHWNLHIGDKSISFQGVTIGMEYSKAKSILHSNGWSYDGDSDEDVESDDSIYYEKDLSNDWEYGSVEVEFEDGKVKSIEFFTDGD